MGPPVLETNYPGVKSQICLHFGVKFTDAFDFGKVVIACYKHMIVDLFIFLLAVLSLKICLHWRLDDFT